MKDEYKGNGGSGESPTHGKTFKPLESGDGSEGCHQHGGHEYYSGQGGSKSKGSTGDSY